MAYETSPLYKEAIKKESRVTFIDGELIASNGVVINITNETLVPGGFYITNQCSKNDSFEFGSVYTAELGITLKTEIDRYTLYDSKLRVFFNVLLSDKTYERIPLGEFNVNEPTRSGKNISIKAYDNMIKLEEELYESTTGTPYELLFYISTKCGISLAQSKEDILNLINGNILLNVEASRVSTYRELLSYICQVTCTFGIFDRFGKLMLCEYGMNPSSTILAKERTSSKFSDFETYFSGAKGQMIFGDSLKAYTQTDGSQGIIYDMGDVPIVQGLDDTNFGVVSNVSQKVQSIRYVPCDITFSGDPSIDLGDMVASIDRDGNEIRSLVTFYKWTYRGKHQLKCAGQNPKLNKLKGKQSKEMANLKADVLSKDLTVYTFTNASELNITGGDNAEGSDSTAIISFATTKSSTCLAMVTIPYEISSESNVVVHQLFDGYKMPGGTIYQRCHEGKGTISFFNYFNTESNSIHRYSLVVQTEGIENGEAGTIKIEPYTLKLVVFGQGLASLVQWDGVIAVGDSIPIIDVITNRIEAVKIADGNISFSNALHNPNHHTDIVREITVTTNKILVNVGERSDSIITAFDY